MENIFEERSYSYKRILRTWNRAKFRTSIPTGSRNNQYQIHTTICRATGTGVIGCVTGPRASNHVYSALSVDIIVQHAESLISTRKRSFGHNLP